MATLEQFLKTGDLGAIRPGMTQAEAIAVLGPPPDESVTARPKILKYGGLQLTFVQSSAGADRQLALIGLYFDPAEPIPEAVRPADFHASPETTAEEVLAFLGRVGLKEAAARDSDDGLSLILPSGTAVVFDNNKLNKIIFASRSNPAAKKQVSLSIPVAVWKQLQTVARQSRRSVGELCAEWILERAQREAEQNRQSA